MFTEKDSGVESFMEKLTGKKRVANECTTCESPVLDFKDDLSAKEYSISGMCQTCQNELEELEDA